jgi:hypothetical protein
MSLFESSKTVELEGINLDSILESYIGPYQLKHHCRTAPSKDITVTIMAVTAQETIVPITVYSYGETEDQGDARRRNRGQSYTSRCW